MRDRDDTFVWGEDRLESATREVLVEIIEGHHEQLERHETEIQDLRESIEFLLDVQSGRTDRYRPEGDERRADREDS